MQIITSVEELSHLPGLCNMHNSGFGGGICIYFYNTNYNNSMIEYIQVELCCYDEVISTKFVPLVVIQTMIQTPYDIDTFVTRYFLEEMKDHAFRKFWSS
jgi:hypothetical protein